MKLSVSIPDDDVAFVDRYAAHHHHASRSQVFQRALSLLRASELADDYEAAWSEWGAEDGVWEAAAGDGID